MEYIWLTLLAANAVIVCLFIEGTNGLYSAAKLPVKSRRDLHRSGINCAPCNTHNCNIVLPESCPGRIIKDHCDCCPICNTTDVVTVPKKSHKDDTQIGWHEDGQEDPDVCKQIDCPRQQICLLNIQGIPVCRCPSSLYCKDRPRKEICSEEDKTYRSLCYLKMEACLSDRKIAVKHKGPCEGDVLNKEERKRIKAERQEKRLERQRLKIEKKGKHGRKDHNGDTDVGKRKKKNTTEKLNAANNKHEFKKLIREQLKKERRRNRKRLRKIMKNELEKEKKASTHRQK